MLLLASFCGSFTFLVVDGDKDGAVRSGGYDAEYHCCQFRVVGKAWNSASFAGRVLSLGTADFICLVRSLHS